MDSCICVGLEGESSRNQYFSQPPKPKTQGKNNPSLHQRRNNTDEPSKHDILHWTTSIALLVPYYTRIDIDIDIDQYIPGCINSIIHSLESRIAYSTTQDLTDQAHLHTYTLTKPLKHVGSCLPFLRRWGRIRQGIGIGIGIGICIWLWKDCRGTKSHCQWGGRGRVRWGIWKWFRIRGIAGEFLFDFVLVHIELGSIPCLLHGLDFINPSTSYPHHIISTSTSTSYV